MKKILFSFKMPRKSYFGGIAVILSQYKENYKAFQDNGFLIEHFDYYNKYAEALLKIKIGQLVYAILERKALRKYIDEKEVDILHLHTSIKWLLFKDILLLRYIGKHCNCKIVLSIHFADIEKILYRNKFIAKIELNILNYYANKVIFLSKNTQNEFVKAGLFIGKSEVLYTFHNVVNEQCCLPTTEEGVQLVFMGSIDQRKGILDLLYVLEEIKQYDYILHICGAIKDESIRAEFDSLCKKLGDKVIFEGYVTGERKTQLLLNSDILILPSYGEGMPIVIMEGMACGCSIISTNVGAIPEIIEERNGELIEPGDIEALKIAITKRLTDRTLLKKEKEFNYEYGKKYSLENNIKDMSLIYQGMETHTF